MWLLALLAGCGSDAEGTAPASLPRVVVALAAEAPPLEERRVPALVEARRDAVLAARGGGTVLSRVAESGQRVGAGDPILRFDRREAAATLASARAQLADADALLADAEARLARIEALGDAVSPQDLDAARTAAARARAGRQAASAQRDLADVRLSYLTVTAPFAGVVASLEPEVGETVVPGAPVARVVDDEGLVVTVGLLEDEVGRAALPGAAFVVELADRELPATVRHVAPAASPQTLTWPVQLAVDANAALRPGLPVTVVARLPSPEGGVRVPIQSVGPSGRVWTVEDGRLRAHPVEVLRERGTEAVVRGIPAEATVMVRGPARPTEGLEVVIVGEGS